MIQCKAQKEKESSNYPKNYMYRILKQYDKKSDMEIFNQIAQNTRPAILNDKCNISFTKFYEDMRRLFK